MDKKQIGSIIVVTLAMIVIIGALSGVSNTAQELENDWIIKGSPSCTEDYECHSFIYDCLTHVEPGWKWANDIKCIGGVCRCIGV